MSDIDLNRKVHVKIRKDGDLGWNEKDFTEYHLLSLIRILFKENRHKELGYFFYDLYSQTFPKERVKKKLAEIGISSEELKKYDQIEKDKKILSTVSKLEKNGHKH